MLTGDGQTILKRALRLVEASDNALFELLGSTAEEFTAQLRVLWTRQP
jgi:hypothetical protein